MRYVDPDGRTEVALSKYIESTISSITTTSITSIKSDITESDFNYLKDTVGKAWATGKKTAASILQDSVNALNTSFTVADIIATASGTSLLPPPYNAFVTGSFLLVSFLLDSANKDKLGEQLKGIYQFQASFDNFKNSKDWNCVSFTVTETDVKTETYHDRNTPYTTSRRKKYLELQAVFKDKQGNRESVYKLLEID